MIKISHKKIILILIVLAILGIIVLALLAEKIGLIENSDVGYLHINHFENGWTLLIDNQPEEISSRNPNIKVPTGLRDIIVFADGYWPWFKQIRVDDGQISEISPFLAPKSPSLEKIPASDPEYDRLVKDSSSRIPATLESPVKSSDSSTVIYVENGDVYAKWQSEENLPSYFCLEKCTPTILIMDSQTEIRNIAFWQDRNDVVVISADKSLYVFEMDSRGIRNFAPIYEGDNPTFHSSYDGSIYVYDQKELLKLVAE